MTDARRIDRAKEQGRKPPVMRSTDYNQWTSPLDGPIWRSGGRCLIPARHVIEPSDVSVARRPLMRDQTSAGLISDVRT